MKKQSKKIFEGEYSWGKNLKMMREMGVFTSQLIFCYPSRIERNIDIAKSSNDDNDLETCLSIINRLQEEAADILKRRDYPTDLKSLESMKDYDPMTGKEADADIQIMNAKQVLVSATRLKKIIAANQGEAIFFETLKLLAASMTASAQPFTLRGVSSTVGEEKSHTKKKPEGFEIAVEQIRREYPALQKKRKEIWGHLRGLDKAGNPWTTADESATYTITFKDKDTIALTTTTKKGEKTITRKKSTFLNNYCTPGDSEQTPVGGCNENGWPIDPSHPWNQQNPPENKIYR